MEPPGADRGLRILFLDPRSDLIPRLAREEGQAEERMLKDLATSLGVCRRLHTLIEQFPTPLPPEAELHIRVYDEVPHFAYHRQDDDVIIGFFGDHFAAIFDRASKAGCIIERTPNRDESVFNEALYTELRNVLTGKLDRQLCHDLMGTD